MHADFHKIAVLQQYFHPSLRGGEGYKKERTGREDDGVFSVVRTVCRKRKSSNSIDGGIVITSWGNFLF